ncbi:MAG: aldehyde ferredoxin oxidoreductase family protein [Planctomycetota bacterium]|nr:aldehyde ferredoxin oxidoreductase family protein [Planctomycetota bacterium]MDA1177368.1 aldehyde ferredoxin oxidoreductase family protein [Planctomycetota bacterium]
MGGWTGKLLRVNLTTGSHRIEPIPGGWLRDYLGGRGLADRYAFEELDPTVEPLSPENVLIFATGPLTGTPVPCGARYMVVTKGALTGAITTSNSGGHFGPELKFAGYDLLILEGKSPRPSYLFIYDQHVEIRPADDFWGKGVFETEDGLRRELGIPQLRVACIGQAGEKLVRFACIMNDKHRAAGRSGVGAVMGSKNLKAIAVRGTQGVPISDPVAFMKAVGKMRHDMKDHPGRIGFTELGTAATIDMTQAFGGLPTRNFLEGQFDEFENLNGNTIRDTRMVANKACFACTIACGRVTRLGDAANKYLVNMHPRNWRMAAEGPEYENAWALGADTGVGDLDAVLKANWLCNDLGMDPISMGATLAAAMELYQEGALQHVSLEMPLKFGSAEALIRMVEATGHREGFGDELAEGSKRMGEKFLRPEVFMGSKGQEFPAYDPRGFQGMGVAYATCNRGGCHLRAWTPGPETSGVMDPHTPVGKGEWVRHEQDRTTVHDNTGICLFVGGAGGPVESLVPCAAAATGIPYTIDEFVKIGERTWNLERLWNLRAGFTRAEDSLPKRLLQDAHRQGPSAGVVVQLEPMLDDYYRERGWDDAGRPTADKLESLGLANL